MIRLFLAICLFRAASAGKMCGLCSNLPEPKDCDRVMECDDHEVCAVEKYARGGIVMIDLYCEDPFTCHSHVGKRNASYDQQSKRHSTDDGRQVLCKQCCDSDLCSITDGLCGMSTLDKRGGHLCYNCDQMVTPNLCDKITLCTYTECYVGQRENKLSSLVLWESRCGHNTSECRTTSGDVRNVQTNVQVVVGKRDLDKRYSGQRCTGCCHDDLCNRHCSLKQYTTTAPKPTTTTTTTTTTTHAPTPKPTTTTTTTTPRPTTTTTTPRPTTTTPTTTTTHAHVPPYITSIDKPSHIQLGSTIRLKCHAHGYPAPKTMWSIQTTTGHIPSNVKTAENDTVLIVDNFVFENYGNYMCRAYNDIGEDDVSTVELKSP